MVLVSKYVSLSSITAAGLTPILFVAFEHETAFNTGLPVTVFCILLAVLVAVRHKSNIQRLLSGTENKVLVSKKEV